MGMVVILDYRFVVRIKQVLHVLVVVVSIIVFIPLQYTWSFPKPENRSFQVIQFHVLLLYLKLPQ